VYWESEKFARKRGEREEHKSGCERSFPSKLNRLELGHALLQLKRLKEVEDCDVLYEGSSYSRLGWLDSLDGRLAQLVRAPALQASKLKSLNGLVGVAYT
jgi:hypothetical protein